MKPAKEYLLVVARLAMGILFCFSGISKLIRPNEYFQIAIAQYSLFPYDIIPWISHVIPWVELLLGAHLVFGLYVSFAAGGLAILSGMFQVVLAQAVLRQLPIDECGCIGGGIFHFTLYQSFAIDTLLAVILIFITTAENLPLAIDENFFE